MLKLRKILVPTDFSDYSAAALRYAAALAKEYDATLLIVHVDLPLSPAARGIYSESLAYPRALIEALEQARQTLVEQLQQVKPPVLNLKVERHLLEGDPVEAIVDLARSSNCDLIVMGTHGRTGLVRALLGSVAEGVVRRSPCPVMTIKLPTLVPEAGISTPQTAAPPAPQREACTCNLAATTPQVHDPQTLAAKTTKCLRDVPLFAGLTASEQRDVEGAMVDETYRAGQEIVASDPTAEREGPPPGPFRALFVILAGEAEVLIDCPVAGEVAVRSLKPGDLFGESSFFHPSRHSATVRAVTDVRVFRLDREAYEDLVRRRSLAPYKLAHNAAEILADRLQRTDRLAAEMAQLQDDAEAASLWRQFRTQLQSSPAQAEHEILCPP